MFFVVIFVLWILLLLFTAPQILIITLALGILWILLKVGDEEREWRKEMRKKP